MKELKKNTLAGISVFAFIIIIAFLLLQGCSDGQDFSERMSGRPGDAMSLESFAPEGLQEPDVSDNGDNDTFSDDRDTDNKTAKRTDGSNKADNTVKKDSKNKDNHKDKNKDKKNANTGNNKKNSGGTGSDIDGDTPSQSSDNKDGITVSLAIFCNKASENPDKLRDEVRDERIVPSGGVILAETAVTLNGGESVFDITMKLCRERMIHFEYSGSAVNRTVYVMGINNLYQFDAGPLSGWMFSVNGRFISAGCSQYVLKQGDRIEWHYSCDLGKDLEGSS